MIEECSTHATERSDAIQVRDNLRITEIQSAIADLSVRKDKATSLSYTDLATSIQSEMDTLQAELDILEA